MASVTGACLCGAVRYRAEIDKEELGSCHCEMCRRWSGGVLLEVTAQPGAVQFEGEEHIRSYTSSPWAERAFCDTCGSALYYRVTAEGPHHGLMMLAAGTLDDMGEMALTTQVYIDRKPPGYSFAETTHNLTKAEIEAMFADS